jgi:hypothetical protein
MNQDRDERKHWTWVAMVDDFLLCGNQHGSLARYLPIWIEDVSSRRAVHASQV